MKAIGWQDYLQATINRQETLTGTSIVKAADATKVYFVLSIIGSTVTIKNGAGTTIMVTSSISFHNPLRLEGGYDISASGTVYATIVEI